jgi:drug/metabolite transporter (DMT)-like permease
MATSRENLGFALGAVGVVIFAGTLPAARLAVATIDPWFLTMGRAAIAGTAALAILLMRRARLPPRSTWGAMAVSTLGLVFAFPAFSALAMVRVPAAHGGVVLGLLPLATAAAATLLGYERPSGGFWLAGAAGTGLVVAFALRSGGAQSLVGGDLLLIASIAAAAIGYALAARLSLTMPGWEVICWQVVLSLPLSVAGLLAFWPPDLAAIPGAAWAAFAYVGLMSQLVGFFAWNAGLALGGIARVGQIQLLQPFVIVALAALINREAVDLETIGFAIAVVGMVMIGRRMHVGQRKTAA